MLILKNIQIILLGITIILFVGSGCSLFESKPEGPTKAEIAEQKRVDKLKAEKEAAAIKKAEEEKAAAKKKQADKDEDTIQLKKIETIKVPKAEKLSDEGLSQRIKSDPVSDAKPESLSNVISSGVMNEKSKNKLPTTANTYLITVEKKNKTHPYLNQGDPRGFVVNGKQGQYVIAKRGEEITFQVRTGVQHDFYLTTASRGWGAAPFTKGVEGMFTYNGDVSFKPSKDTPNDLFYGCRNHNAMGGKIVVVDANVDLAKMTITLEAERKLAEKNAKSSVNKAIKPQKVRQKIAYVSMLLRFKGKSLEAGYEKAIKIKLEDAKQLEKKGQLAAAFDTAVEANAMFTRKSKKQGLTKEQIAEQKEELNDLMITLEAFIDSHKASYKQTKKNAPNKLVDYDHELVEKLVVKAIEYSKKNQFNSAKNQMRKAERLVTKALNDMLNSQTIVYDLNFETPADEYAYEIKKYESYLELIPVAIEVKKPGKGSIQLMKTYVKKGKFFKEKADEAAKADRWKEAMVVIRDATLEVRRGLRLLGVSM